MNMLRLSLIAVGCVFAILACGALVGAVSTVLEEDETVDGQSLIAVVFVIIAFVVAAIVCLVGSNQMVVQNATKNLSNSHSSCSAIDCPSCSMSSIVRACEDPNWFIGRKYIARCTACGCRIEVKREQWNLVPLGAHDDDYATAKDRTYAALQSPMTVIQIVLTIILIIGFSTIMFMIIGRDHPRWVELVISLAFSGVAIWGFRLIRIIFPAKSPREE